MKKQTKKIEYGNITVYADGRIYNQDGELIKPDKKGAVRVSIDGRKKKPEVRAG